MKEYIVKETGFPGVLKQNIVGELIRCKNCIHWREGDVYSYCDKLCRVGDLDIYAYMTSEDDFCSKAERENHE